MILLNFTTIYEQPLYADGTPKPTGKDSTFGCPFERLLAADFGQQSEKLKKKLQVKQSDPSEKCATLDVPIDFEFM